MRLLIDTNIILEVLLVQEKSQEAQALPSQNDQHDFFLSDYAFKTPQDFIQSQSSEEGDL